MSCSCPTDCDTTQIIEPRNDFIVDTAGSASDIDERGDLALTPGQPNAVVAFQVLKLNASYDFEYLYIDAMGISHPGGVVVVPTVRSVEGFAVVFTGAPVEAGHVLHWRVVVRLATTLVQIDAPEDLYLPMPRANLMGINFINPRSGINYGFTEMSVENLVDPPAGQAIIRVQVYLKTQSGCAVAVNPTPPTGNYFLHVRTP
jgi:hypothetical protein